MSTSTPERRRALAPLDANKQSPAPSRLKFDGSSALPKKPVSPVSVRGLALARSPVKSLGTEARKRPLEVFPGDENGVIAKKTCVEAEVERVERTADDFMMPTERDQSASPDASSIFDSSGLETHNSTATEVELGDGPQRVSLSRAQTRKMAGDLLTRLRLANYKVRTGQAHIPFTQLEARSLHERRSTPLPTLQVQQPSPPSASQRRTTEMSEAAEDATRQQQLLASKPQTTTATATIDRRNESKDAPLLEASTYRNAGREEHTLPPSLAPGKLKPGKAGAEEECLTSSVRRGGAASGLLRLAKGDDS